MICANKVEEIKNIRRKKRVTAGKVDTSGTELRKRAHQWTTNDEKSTNERFRHSVSSSGQRRKTDNNKIFQKNI